MVLNINNIIRGAIVTTFLAVTVQAPLTQAAENVPKYHPTTLLVKSAGVNIGALHESVGAKVLKKYRIVDNLELVELPKGITVEDAISFYKQSRNIRYAEPNYYGYANATPNDTYYASGSLWNLHNYGQNGGTADADIDAPEAWDVRTSARNVIVAVIDSGVQYNHPDLSANMWQNIAELNGSPGVDDDGNGYIDDVYGINAIDGTGNPGDANGHGTHVAGIIGAKGSNSIGVVGVAWDVQIMALKFMQLQQGGGVGGTYADAIECIDYAVHKGAHILNNSWAGTADSGALREAIARARNHDILFVAGAGNVQDPQNPQRNNDTDPVFPASIEGDNIVSVAATTKNDALPDYSHYGQVRVHLAAPGGHLLNGITSCYLSNSYSSEFKTSMAAPHVSGAFALLKAEFPFESCLELKNRLLSGVDRLPTLNGYCQTGGRLNLRNALASGWPSRPPNDTFGSAFTLVRPASGQITTVANNVNATKESGEPNHAGNAGGKSVWWTWTAPDTTTVTFKTEGSGFNTLLAVYTGTAVNNLTLVAADNDGCQCGTSQVTFAPTQGTTYRIAVDGHDGASGTIKLTIQNGAATAPASLRFLVDTAQRTAGQFTVELSGPPLTQAWIERSLGDIFNWQGNYQMVLLDYTGHAVFTDFNAPQGARFYRASVILSQTSCNTVGYVDFFGIAANANTLVGSPLNRGGNTVAEVFVNVPEGTSLYKWNEPGGYFDGATYIWGEWDNPNLVLRPGEGLYFQNPTANPLTLTFVGEVPQGYLVNSVNNGWTMRSSMVPQAGLLTKELLFPAIEGDRIYRTENGTLVEYRVQNGAWTPSVPTMNIGEAFWSYKGVGFWWSRNFLVWP